MALKLILDTLEGVADAHKVLYVPEGEKFRLDVDGAVPREKLDEFRNTNIDLLKKLEGFKGIDAAKYADLIKLETRVSSKELIEAGKLEEVVNGRIQGMKVDHDKIVGELNEQLSNTSKQLEHLLIDSSVRVKALENGVFKSAVDDVLLRAKSTFKIVNGQAVPHADGKPVYGKDGVNPMSVEEWIVALAKSATHLFEQSRGGNAQGSRGQRGQDSSKMSPAQKIAAGLTQNA